MMKNDDIEKCAPEHLAELMDLGLTAPTRCSSEELATLLLHQLSVPVAFDLGGLNETMAREIEVFCSAEELTGQSLGALFAHAHPPVRLFELIKCYAKACRQDLDSPIPEEIAVVLYFASVGAALLKCRKRITTLDNASLKKGLAQVLEQPWLNPSLRSLLEETLEHLKTEETDP